MLPVREYNCISATGGLRGPNFIWGRNIRLAYDPHLKNALPSINSRQAMLIVEIFILLVLAVESHALPVETNPIKEKRSNVVCGAASWGVLSSLVVAPQLMLQGNG
jgi:hypothetical protein